MDNPFIFGKVVAGNQFVNRQSEVDTISKTLRSGQNVILYSPRRYGKTSLMMQIRENLKNNGQLVFFIDFFRVTSIEDMYSIYASSIVAAIKSPIKILFTTLQQILPSINPKVIFKGLDMPTVEVSVPVPVLQKSETLRELFDSLEKYCAKKKKRGTVIFDEFQEITSIKDGVIIEREMRSAFQHHKMVSYAFLGSKQHLLKKTFRDKNRPFYNFGRHIELDVIDANHWKEYIKKQMKGMCSTESIEKIIHITENHPYYVQMVCHYLWEYAKQHKLDNDKVMVEIVVQEILQKESMFFAELWDGLSSGEKHLLKAIASDETTSVYEKKFVITHNLGTPSMVQKAVEKLLQRDYLRKTPDGKFTLINPLFKLWMNSLNVLPY